MASLFTNIDHDEGQYVAAVALMRDGLPYRNFAYLQTPLQPLLFAPLAWICEGWLFPALRALNALLSAGASQINASRRAATFAAFCLASSHMLLFAATAARNDALPLFLHVAGLWLFLSSLREGAGESGIKAVMAGLALGAAASAKISYGLPAVAIGIFALTHWRTLRPSNVAMLALGGVLGGTPTFWLWALAPEAARFGIFDYSLKAPFEWRMLNGQSFMFGTQLSLLRLLRFLGQGGGLIALLAVALMGEAPPSASRRASTQADAVAGCGNCSWTAGGVAPKADLRPICRTYASRAFSEVRCFGGSAPLEADATCRSPPPVHDSRSITDRVGHRAQYQVEAKSGTCSKR
ncbi:hypothetical protein [Sphingobium sp. SCG-1]|uniref:hypothetical protein n=1 Tax=Sphingobium sp. SCG-1 TaxID=2072936 RepID=UPI0016716DBB|nr:hypothetical protein [Sphingobium sp. SCG-1]